jgi:hypothetical protein
MQRASLLPYLFLRKVRLVFVNLPLSVAMETKSTIVVKESATSTIIIISIRTLYCL